MPLTDSEREELAKKINQQRRSMWKGQVSDENRPNKKGKKADINVPESRQNYTEPEHPVKLPDPVIEEETDREIVHPPINQPVNEIKPTPIEPPANDREKLADKVKEQRRSVWAGETKRKKSKRKKDSRKITRSTNKILNYSQESVPVEKTSEKQPLEAQLEEPKNRKKGEGFFLKAPALKLALIVIVCLIGAISIGIAVGYIIASQNLLEF